MTTFPSETQATAAASPAYLQILGQLEIAQKAAKGGRLIGLCGCREGDGASFVLNELACNLARSSRKRVLRINAMHLLGAVGAPSARLLNLCRVTEEPGVWQLQPGDEPATPRPDEDTMLETALSSLATQFQFVLLDLGAVTTAGQLWHFAPVLDDLLLVVAAGETRRSQITFAQRVIAQAHGRLTGCVLNRRTYPLPQALFRALN